MKKHKRACVSPRLALQGVIASGRKLRQDGCAYGNRVMVAFDRPCHLDSAVVRGFDEETKCIRFGKGRPRTDPTGIADVAAALQSIQRNRLRLFGCALAAEIAVTIGERS